MKELEDIVKAYDDAVRQKKEVALATVVHVEGSSYRRPGARMLVTVDGMITGAISGGCLEGDALRKARLAIFQKENRLVVYDTTDDDDLKFGVQLGCNGIVSILFEPVEQRAANNPLELIRRVVAERKNSMLVTAFSNEGGSPHPGTCGYISAGQEKWTLVDAFVAAEARRRFEATSPAIETYPHRSVLYQFIPPVVQIVIAGAGNDSMPLVEMASILGWHVIVVDGRLSHATMQRFPKANKLIAQPANDLSEIPGDEYTAYVLMTHNYNYDVAVLANLSSRDFKYIAVLGPKKKLQRMIDELEKRAVVFTKEQRSRIHGPAGLDIGAEAPEEIALSIIAEIKASFSGRPGTALKFKDGSIYERSQ